MSDTPTKAMIAAGLWVLEESGLVEGSWTGLPSSAGLTVAEIYEAMEAKRAEDDKYKDWTVGVPKSGPILNGFQHQHQQPILNRQHEDWRELGSLLGELHPGESDEPPKDCA